MTGCPRRAMFVGNVCGRSRFFRRLIIQIVSRAEVAYEIYSASIDESTTEFSFLDIQRLDVSASLKRFPLVDLRSVLSAVQSVTV